MDLNYKNNKRRYTRGIGLLENFLARIRARKADELIDKKSRDGRLLDIGCGSYPYFLLSTDFKEKFGIDKNIRAYTDKGISIKKYDIRKGGKLPYNSNFFDVVTLLAIIEHIDKEYAKALLKEAYRVLKPCGKMILTTPINKANIVLRIMSKLFLVSSEEIQEHKQLYTRKALLELLQHTGFKNHTIGIKTFEFGLNLIISVEK